MMAERVHQDEPFFSEKDVFRNLMVLAKLSDGKESLMYVGFRWKREEKATLLSR